MVGHKCEVDDLGRDEDAPGTKKPSINSRKLGTFEEDMVRKRESPKGRARIREGV
jgi:hypothetical protein